LFARCFPFCFLLLSGQIIICLSFPICFCISYGQTIASVVKFDKVDKKFIQMYNFAQLYKYLKPQKEARCPVKN
jgi:hypothetical protein